MADKFNLYRITDIDECQNKNGGCDQICENRKAIGGQAGFVCKCREGYERKNNMCVNINECLTTNECSANADCTDQTPGYNCTCKKGYRGDGKVCQGKLLHRCRKCNLLI